MTEIIFERKIADDIIIEKAVTVLINGGIIVLPTDTIPGIGCCADNLDAVNRLFDLKNRPETLPLPVILADTDDVNRYAEDIPEIFSTLTSRFWPGALTTVLKSNGTIDKLVGGGLDTLGFRVPDNQLVRKIVRKVDAPLALTSANPHNVSPSAVHEMILNWWKNEVELLILGRSTAPFPPSAVIDLSVDPPKILREGKIPTGELREIIKSSQV